MSPPTRRPPVEHRWLGMDRRGLGQALFVLLCVILVGGVIPAVDRALGENTVQPGTVYSLAGGASFVPTPGWSVAGVPAPSNPEMLLYDDGVMFSIRAGAFDGSAVELIDRIDELDPDLGFTGGVRGFQTADGTPGAARRTFAGDLDGVVFTLVEDGASIRVQVYGPPKQMSDHVEDVGSMVASIRFPGSETPDEASDQ